MNVGRSGRIARRVRRHVVGYVALFFALSGTGYAAGLGSSVAIGSDGLPLGISALVFAASGASGGSVAPVAAARPCSRGAVPARIAGKRACLKVGQRCKRRLERQYRRYGFHCGATRRLTRSKPAPPPPRPVAIKATGSAQVVFDWTTDRCEDLDIPDLPARAFRGADGRVQLISAHFINRRFTGPDLDHLTHDCSVVLGSDSNPDPAAFDDHEWIAAPYTPDGTTVYALVHDEYQGWGHPGQCATTTYDVKCWYNAITLAVSTDGGRSYADHPSPRLVASVPYRYVPGDGPTGVFTPSNIVRNPRDGYYYALAYVNLRDTYIGNCLIRTNNLADPGTWLAWSFGTTFGPMFVDPYGPNEAPSAHLCAPVSPWEPRDLQPNSLTYSTEARQWLLVGQALGGVYFSLSPDLIQWTAPELFFTAQVTWNYKCGDPDPIAYPSVIDPKSTDRNFQTVGGTAYVYFTQFHYSSCQQTLDRDLVRVPIKITAR